MPESVDPMRLRLTNQAGTEGVLLGFQCRDCGTAVFGPATFPEDGLTAKELIAHAYQHHAIKKELP